MSKDADVIVIGAGIGGMVAAGALSYRGYKVLLFEKTNSFGGYCQSFYRRGYRFEAAVNKVGADYHRNILEKYLEIIQVKEKIVWKRFEEMVQIGDKRFNPGSLEFMDILIQQYPKEKENIIRFFKDGHDLANYCIGIQKGDKAIKNSRLISLMLKAANMSCVDYLNMYFENKYLKENILVSSDAYPDWFANVMILVLMHVKSKWSYRIEGGMQKYVNIIEKSIRNNGSQLCKGISVTKIIIKDGKAKGVIAGGKKYYSSYIISNMDELKTYRDLIGINYIGNENYLNMITKDLRPSLSCYTAWYGLDCPITDIVAKIEDVSYYPTVGKALKAKVDTSKANGKFTDINWVYSSICANLDYTAIPEGCSQLTLGLPVAYNFENRWGIDPEKERGSKYKETKKEVSNLLINLANDIYPDLGSHIVVEETATPYTYERYSNNTDGAYLGYYVDTKYARLFINDKFKMSIISGLYTASAWGTVAGGVTNTLLHSMEVVDSILKHDKGAEAMYNLKKRI